MRMHLGSALCEGKGFDVSTARGCRRPAAVQVACGLCCTIGAPAQPAPLLATALRRLQVLNSELKQLRARAHEQDVGAAAAERQLCALRAEVARLQQAVRECAVAPAALLADQECRAQLAQRDRAVLQAEERAALLEKARESAERRFRADLAAERRQQEALRGEAARLKVRGGACTAAQANPGSVSLARAACGSWCVGILHLRTSC